MKSPCTNKCQRSGGVCVSCGRSLDEIEAWIDLSDAEQRKIIKRTTLEKVFTVYTGNSCTWCEQAIALLTEIGAIVQIRNAAQSDEHFAFLAEKGLRTVPQIWAGEKYVGGFKDLLIYVEDNDLASEDVGA